ncbi:MAG: DNA alkylation repair protein [Flavipsychrobacter sp.]
MAEESKLFKDVFFKPSFVDELYDGVAKHVKVGTKKKFRDSIFDKEWNEKELKQRVKHVTEVLHGLLPNSFPKAAKIITDITKELLAANIKEVSFGYMCLCEYIERYGLEYYDESIKAMELLTQFMSCEFAVRPFIIKYEDRMMRQMLQWSKHKNAKVRRLSTEGCRPRLPWGMALDRFKDNPAPILPILENLKNDDDVWVRKSVANNLNDISKDNPELAVKLIKNWLGKTKHTDWVAKHAARTLLKQGNTTVMSLFGLEMDKSIKLSDFKVLTPTVKEGKDLKFSFRIHNTGKKDKVLRLEYGMYYLRANGTLSKKVFKISERSYAAGEEYNVERKQSFKPITTRKYYKGPHKVSVIINGHEMDTSDFKLI